MTATKKGRPIKCRSCGHQFSHNSNEKRNNWREKKLVCPSCQMLYCCLPKTERELRVEQDNFFDNSRNEKFMTKIYKILISYASSLIYKFYSNVLTSRDDVECHAHHAATFLIEEFYRRDDFRIEDSFGGFLILKLKQSIWGKQEHLIDDVSINHMNELNQKIQISDNMGLIEKVEDEIDSHLVRKYMMEMIEAQGDSCNDENENLMVLVGLNIFMKKGEKWADRFFNEHNGKGIRQYNSCLNTIKDELQKIAA